MKIYDFIKNRISLSDYLKRYIKLEKRGNNYIACCPFHAEKTPSFYVYTASQHYHCYGCGEHGDIFNFLQKIENLSQEECIKKLCLETNIEIPSFLKEKDVVDKHGKSLSKNDFSTLLEKIEKFHHEILSQINSSKTFSDEILSINWLMSILKKKKSFFTNIGSMLFRFYTIFENIKREILLQLEKSEKKSSQDEKSIEFSSNNQFNQDLLINIDKYQIFLKDQCYKFRENSFLILLVLEKLTLFFQKSLFQKKAAQSYLKKRNINDFLLLKSRIGYIPEISQMEDKINILLEKYSEKVVLSIGIFSKNEKGKIFSIFSDRITIPIFDEFGNVVSFGARSFHDKSFGAKYINGSESSVFSKKNLLYNFSNVARFIYGEKDSDQPLFLVEGYFDVLSFERIGIHTAVSFSGTAFSDFQIAKILSLKKRVFIAFDGDEAGISSAAKICQQIITLNQSFEEIRVVVFPPNSDPDEFLSKLISKESPLFVLKDRSFSFQKFIFDFFAKQYLPFLKNHFSKDALIAKKEFSERIALLRNQLNEISRKIKDISLRFKFMTFMNDQIYSLRKELSHFSNQFSDNSLKIDSFPENRFIALLLLFPDLFNDNREKIESIFCQNSLFSLSNKKIVELRSSNKKDIALFLKSVQNQFLDSPSFFDEISREVFELNQLFSNDASCAKKEELKQELFAIYISRVSSQQKSHSARKRLLYNS